MGASSKRRFFSKGIEMKKQTILTLAFLLATSISAYAQVEKSKTSKPWFDMEQCAMCKHMSMQPGLMEAMKWEVHKIDNGMLMVAYVPDNMKAAFKKAMIGMEETGKQLADGKQLPMCGFCEEFGKAKMKGAREQNLESKISEITLITSDDSQVVNQLHQIADRTIKEMKLMEQQQASKSSETPGTQASFRDKKDK
jgi:hypothetical protein